MGDTRHLDATGLFGGIGGLELGLSRAGHRTSAFCEIDPEAATVLRRRFPEARHVRDVRDTDALLAAIAPTSQLLTAGFPCTDLSQAGRTAGFDGEASSLVRDVFKLLRRRPFEHVVLENVPNWRLLHRGAYLAEVADALETLGYRWAYRTVDARAFGVPQRRLRIFLYASLSDDPRGVLFPGDVEPTTETHDLTDRAHGFYWTEGVRGLGWGEDCVPTLKGGSTIGVPSPPGVLMPDLSVVTPTIEHAEAMQGLPRGWTEAAVRADGGAFRDRRRWVLVGNAVNVDAAAWLGDRLAAPQGWNGPDGAPLTAGDRWPAAASFDGVRRRAHAVGPWPLRLDALPLAALMGDAGVPLSARATAGFVARLKSGGLRLRDGFLAALEAHLARVGNAARPDRRDAA